LTPLDPNGSLDFTMTLPLIPVPRRDSRGRWDLGEASAEQWRLRDRVVAEDRFGPVRRVAGADVSYERLGDTLYAAVVVLDVGTLEPVETATAIEEARLPYLPGYLSFREAPAIEKAFGKLGRRPDLLMVDGHGQAHPRGFGIACHLGVTLDVPSIGVAKSVLVGRPEAPSGKRGSIASLELGDARLGSVVRTRDHVSPVYVSVGHRISLKTAVRWVLKCGAGYRIPEPIRRAHLAVNKLRMSGRSLS
jgi:deoxyribonuclease V